MNNVLQNNKKIKHTFVVLFNFSIFFQSTKLQKIIDVHGHFYAIKLHW